MLKSDIDKDLKEAMLSGDKRLVEMLRTLKSAILYKEVADGNREEGLSDEEIVAVLKKEKKSRNDAIALYQQAGETQRASEEQYQIDVITKYLPEEMSEEAIGSVVAQALSQLSIESPEQKDMGMIIGAVKKLAPSADGALIAKVVKESIK
jgi:uncharacterized protein YqeY